MDFPPTLSTPAPSAPADARRHALRQSAEALESAFLAEMLKAAGIGRPAESHGGGAGEEHFASFQADVAARALMVQGGIGLADRVERALSARSGDMR